MPRLGTTWVLIGSAGGGRPLGTLDVRIERATAIESLQIPGIGNIDVDMVFAGLREEDLPRGLSPDALEFTTSGLPGSRAVPPLVDPHVLRAPSPPGTAGELVPAGEDADRVDRLERLLSELAIVDPCKAPLQPIEVKPQRSQAGAITRIEPLSTGEIAIGLSVTSTALVGYFADGQQRMRELPVQMGNVPVMPGENVDVSDFGAGEIEGDDGQTRPSVIALVRGDRLGHLAVWSSTMSRYRDDTPRHLSLPPAGIRSVVRVEDGIPAGDSGMPPAIPGPALCLTGSVEGMPGRFLGGIWCRSEPSGAWSEIAIVEGAVSFTALIVRPELGLVAVDAAGAAWSRTRSGSWQEVARPAINQACAPLCAGFRVVSQSAGAAGPVLVAAGDKARLVAVRGSAASDLRVEAVDAVAGALFADERAGEEAVAFASVEIAPDGAVWLGMGKRIGFVLRVSPSGDGAERICLPEGAMGAEMTALATSSDGKLWFGMSPPRIGVGTWRSP